MDEFAKRFSAAKAHRRERVEEEGREVYKFCFNGRESEWDENVRSNDDAEEIFTDIVATVAEEFHGELFSTMTPENSPWVEYEAGNGVDESIQGDTKDQLEAFEKIISKALRSSNYYDEGQMVFQDAVVGTVAMWVDRPTLSSPLVCEAIPISQCYLRLGPLGIEDRFRRQWYYYSDLPALFPEADFDQKMRDKIKNSGGRAKIVRGFWRDYKDASNPFWRQEVRIDDKPQGLDRDLEGDGSCPMIVGRYNPVPNSAWGRGPGRRMLPTLRVLNEITRMNLEGMDKNLDPAFTYPHDGILNLKDGIENGLGYPMMPGSGDSIQPLGLFGNLDYGFFSEERLQELVRDGFYRDTTQRGKTPPSASQYMGEEQKQVRRMARPAAKLWREFGVGLLKRTEYLERQPGGGLEGKQLPLLDSGTVIARPISPLERAQAREDVLVAQSIMQMTQEGVGPDQAGLLIDGPKTFRNIKETLKDRLVEFRSEKELQAMLQQMQQAQQPPGAPA